ncbi:site-specific integrase [Herbidospora galbida]|uniref:site-specific integrase n=1 Tax=Herbidospora galbida TaxID=2575442 RepID=UPI001484EEB4|nr:hypothetical protein [Herbidospora galbida]
MAYKRCSCADKTTGKRLGGRCGRLAEPGHGSWYFAVQVMDVSGCRRRVRQGGFSDEAAARQAASDLIASGLVAPVSAQCTVGRWLTYWLSIVEQRLRPPTVKAYQDHVRLFLSPHLGPIPLNRLTRRHLVRMFVMISRRRTRYGTPIAAATLQRIRATLRAALNEAVQEDLIADNPARGPRLPTPRHVHPVVWTTRQVALWKCTGERPSVAVWTPEQLAQFLAFVRNDSLFALWWLIALRGLRRGEAAGLRWVDLDIERRELAITRQVVRTPAGLRACRPKSETSVRNIALEQRDAADPRPPRTGPAVRAWPVLVVGEPDVHRPRG